VQRKNHCTQKHTFQRDVGINYTGLSNIKQKRSSQYFCYKFTTTNLKQKLCQTC